MGLPRIRVECYHSLQWGTKYEKALRRLLVDPELSPDLRNKASAMVEQVSDLHDLLLATGSAIQPPTG